ncbi:iron transporter FeoA [Heyndrickxia sporothermodurans]|nr:iron transporter FeoA [Heyndrickxia sporothermodurans]
MSNISSQIPLSECCTGNRLVITELQIEGVMRRRLLDLGFVRGAEILVLQKSPLGDPIAFRVRDTTIALRREESSKIFGVVVKED